MSGWAGFSDEELRKMQQKDSPVPSAVGRGRKPALAPRTRQQIQREKALQSAAPSALPPGQRLSEPPPKEAPPAAAPPVAAPPVAAPPVAAPPVAPPAAAPDEKQEENPAPKELEKQEVALREKTRLEQLQQEQKIIEERNKRKKALLAKTIAEKSKQTQAEAVKLKRIQKELQALDDMVSNDIGILRGKIEQASWDYSAARKRYEKAEAEYVTAKLDLHKKTEAKEQLTEHLCAIIQQNELRKAHKLEELMQQLQLQATEEELERQREEERRGRAEPQTDGKQGNGSVEKQEETLQPEEGTVREEGGGHVQQEHRPETEPPNTEQECKTLENCVQSPIAAS